MFLFSSISLCLSLFSKSFPSPLYYFHYIYLSFYSSIYPFVYLFLTPFLSVYLNQCISSVNIYIYIYIYIYICAYICIYIYIYLCAYIILHSCVSRLLFISFFSLHFPHTLSLPFLILLLNYLSPLSLSLRDKHLIKLVPKPEKHFSDNKRKRLF